MHAVLWIVGRIVLFALVALCVLLLVALVRTLLMKTKKADYVPKVEKERENLYTDKLAKMVQCETISHRGVQEVEKFRDFHKVLQNLFPTVFEKLEKVDIDGNLLMKWKGKSSEKPVLFMSHQDVVEASGAWTYPPFSGTVSEGLIYGRGTGDTKCSVMAFYQATEELLKQGFVPQKDIYLFSSCTEEVGGDGAPKIVAYLKSKGVHLDMLSDEGGGIIKDPMPGVKGAFAMIGVYEKGQGNVQFIAKGQGGHASAPKKNTPLCRLSKFVAQVDNKSPFKAVMSQEVSTMFTRLSPYASFPMRFVFSNLWLFKPLLVKVLPSISAQAGAMLKTTIAFTMATGSEGANVIPQEASVTANLRFVPHQKAKESIEVISELAKKYNLETKVINQNDPSPMVNIHGAAFKLTEKAVSEIFPQVCACPYVVTGGTDSRFFSEICDQCIRFSPVVYGEKQLKGMHGIDETMFTNALPGAVDFYKFMMTQP